MRFLLILSVRDCNENPSAKKIAVKSPPAGNGQKYFKVGMLEMQLFFMNYRRDNCNVYCYNSGNNC